MEKKKVPIKDVENNDVVLSLKDVDVEKKDVVQSLKDVEKKDVVLKLNDVEKKDVVLNLKDVEKKDFVLSLEDVNKKKFPSKDVEKKKAPNEDEKVSKKDVVDKKKVPGGKKKFPVEKKVPRKDAKTIENVDVSLRKFNQDIKKLISVVVFLFAGLPVQDLTTATRQYPSYCFYVSLQNVLSLALQNPCTYR